MNSSVSSLPKENDTTRSTPHKMQHLLRCFITIRRRRECVGEVNPTPTTSKTSITLISKQRRKGTSALTKVTFGTVQCRHRCSSCHGSIVPFTVEYFRGRFPKSSCPMKQCPYSNETHRYFGLFSLFKAVLAPHGLRRDQGSPPSATSPTSISSKRKEKNVLRGCWGVTNKKKDS